MREGENKLLIKFSSCNDSSLEKKRCLGFKLINILFLLGMKILTFYYKLLRKVLSSLNNLIFKKFVENL